MVGQKKDKEKTAVNRAGELPVNTADKVIFLEQLSYSPGGGKLPDCIKWKWSAKWNKNKQTLLFSK